MAKFMVLYHSTVPAKEQMAKATPEQAKAGMEVWMQWMKKVGSALLDAGAPMLPVGSANATTTGYSILQAESAKAAQALLENHPHHFAPGATIELYELQQMPGM